MIAAEPALMEVIQALVDCARAADFDFGEDTALVAAQHMLWQTVDLFMAIKALGIRPENTFALGKIYSNGPDVIRTLRAMGVSVLDSTMPEVGEFDGCFEQDIRHLWQVVADTLTPRQVKRIIVLDDGGKCISNTPPAVLRQYRIGGVEQTSHGMFLFEERPPPFAVTSWARTAVKLQIGGPMFSRCVIDNLRTRFLSGNLVRGEELGIIGFGSIGRGMAQLAVRQGHKVMFYDPTPDLQIPQHLQGKITRLDTLEQLLVSCDYVLGCSGRNPFKDKWPMDHRPGIKLFSGSSGDEEFGPIIRDLREKGGFQVAHDTWDMTSAEGPSGPILIAYHGYPYNFISRDGEAVPTNIVQLETGGLLAGLIQARSHLALHENGDEENTGINRLAPEAQRFVYEAWLKAMGDQGIDVRQRYLYEPAMLSAARHERWFVENTEPNPDSGYQLKTNVENGMRYIFSHAGEAKRGKRVRGFCDRARPGIASAHWEAAEQAAF